VQKEEELEFIGIRVPQSIRTAIEKIVSADMHVSISDFIRDAIREKIQRDYPRVFKEVVEGKK